MEIIYLLVPLSLVLIGAIIWAMKTASNSSAASRTSVPAIGARTTGGETSIGPMWMLEGIVIDSSKEKRRGDRGVLRSKGPDSLLQEVLEERRGQDDTEAGSTFR